jgi:PTH2 family peptidyl-tRNA hydrolase
MEEYKQVIVIRTDLNMRRGKMVAQGAHACVIAVLDTISNGSAGRQQALRDWIANGMTKICVGIDSEMELTQVAADAANAGLTVHLVTDSGRTEFGGVPTKTCLAIGPNEKHAIDLITGTLRLL